MLVLTRKKGQSIMIGDNVEVSVIDVQGEQVKLGIKAPRSVSVHRNEIYEEILSENKKASIVNMSVLKGFNKGKIKGSNYIKGKNKV